MGTLKRIVIEWQGGNGTVIKTPFDEKIIIVVDGQIYILKRNIALCTDNRRIQILEKRTMDTHTLIKTLKEVFEIDKVILRYEYISNTGLTGRIVLWVDKISLETTPLYKNYEPVTIETEFNTEIYVWDREENFAIVAIGYNAPENSIFIENGEIYKCSYIDEPQKYINKKYGDLNGKWRIKIIVKGTKIAAETDIEDKVFLRKIHESVSYEYYIIDKEHSNIKTSGEFILELDKNLNTEQKIKEIEDFIYLL